MKKIISYKNKKFIIKGDYKKDMLVGFCSLKDNKGNLIEGEFKKNKLHGKGLYSGTYDLAESIGFNLPPFKLSIPKHIVISGEFNNDQISINTLIFCSNGNFALITSNNHKEFKGWIAEEEGSFFSFFDEFKSNTPTKEDRIEYKEARELGYKGTIEAFMEESKVTDPFEKIEDINVTNELNHRYIVENNKYLKKTGWFPYEICKNKSSFEKKISKWKKNNKLF